MTGCIIPKVTLMGPVHLSRSTLARPLGGSPQKWLPDRTDTDDTRNKRARIRRIPAGTTRASHELRRAAGPRPADNSLHPNCDPITWPGRASGGTTLANPGSRPTWAHRQWTDGQSTAQLESLQRPSIAAVTASVRDDRIKPTRISRRPETPDGRAQSLPRPVRGASDSDLQVRRTQGRR